MSTRNVAVSIIDALSKFGLDTSDSVAFEAMTEKVVNILQSQDHLKEFLKEEIPLVLQMEESDIELNDDEVAQIAQNMIDSDWSDFNDWTYREIETFHDNRNQ